MAALRVASIERDAFAARLANLSLISICGLHKIVIMLT